MESPLKGSLRDFVLVFCGLCCTPVDGAGQRIEYPEESAVDQPVPIRVSALAPGSVVSLRVEFVDAQDILWSAEATFLVGSSGVVDTSTDAPTDGSYSGPLAAGLFSHAQPVDGAPDRRFASAGLTGVPTSIVLHLDGSPHDTLIVSRHLVPPGVGVREVRESGFRGRLFSPQAPLGGGVVVLGGSEGGFPDGLAAILAGNGYVALSLPYFGVEGLPAELAEIPLESIDHAVRWLRRYEQSGGRVALFGTSKGAEAALLVSTLGSEPDGLVAYAPSSVAWSCICGESNRASWTWEGESLPSVGPGADPTYDAAGGPIRPATHYRYRKRIRPGVGLIEIERYAGPLLLVAGADDQLWPSAEMADELIERRSGEHGHPLDALYTYEDAGHLIGKAFLPAGSTRIARGRLETGGSPRGNAVAQADAWAKVLDFLTAILR